MDGGKNNKCLNNVTGKKWFHQDPGVQSVVTNIPNEKSLSGLSYLAPGKMQCAFWSYTRFTCHIK